MNSQFFANASSPGMNSQILDSIADLIRDFFFVVRLNELDEITDIWTNIPPEELSRLPVGKIPLTEIIKKIAQHNVNQSSPSWFTSLFSGIITDFELPFQTADNERVWLQIRLRGQLDSEQKNRIVLGIVKDVTSVHAHEEEREKIVADIQAVNQLLENQSLELKKHLAGITAVFDTVSDAIIVYDANGIVTRVNQAAIQGYGFDPTGMDYLHLSERLTIKNPQGVPRSKDELVFYRLQQGEPQINQISRMINYSGNLVWQLVSGKPLLENGKMIGAVVTWKDITDLETMRLILEENERKLRSVINHSGDGIELTDESGTIIEWNPAMEKITGLTAKEVIGQKSWDVSIQLGSSEIDQPTSREVIEKRIQKILQTGKSSWLEMPFESRYKVRDGRERIMESNAFSIPTEKGFMFGVISRDVTERKLIEEHLRQARDYYLKLFEDFPAMIWRSTSDGACDYKNKTWLAFTGKSLQDVLVNGWIDSVHPEDRAIVKEQSEVCFNERKTVSLRYRLRRFDGEYRWITDFGQPYTDLDGNFAGYIGVCLEVHDTVERQREMEIVLSVSAALRPASSPEEIMKTLLEQLTILTGAEGAVILMPDDQKTGLVIRSASGLLSALEGISNPYTADDLSNRLINEKTKLVNINLGQLRPDLSRKWHRQFVVGQPLIASGITIGGLWAIRKQAFSEQEVRMINAFSDIAATAIQRASLTLETNQYAEKLRIISDMGRSMSETLDPDGIFALLNSTIHSLFNNVACILVSRYDSDKLAIRCEYCNLNGLQVSPASLPVLPFDPTGRGNQSWVIQNQRPKILNNLPNNTKNSYYLDDGSPQPVSAIYIPMIAEGKVIGVLQVQSYKDNFFTERDIDILNLVASTTAISLSNATLFDNLQQSNRELVSAYDATLRGWAQALELRDQETKGHSVEVVELTLKFALAAGIPDTELDHIRRGALLHDIGKIAIPDSILNKPGPLNDAEWKIMKQHPVYAYQILKEIEFLEPSLVIPYSHHERWDGSGYPQGLRGIDIPLPARLFAIVDVWNALQRERPYRSAWSREKTLQYLKEQAGKQFDPHLVELFLSLINQ